MSPDCSASAINSAVGDTSRLDIAYLETLSADAAPAIAELPPELRSVALVPLANRLAAGDGWGSLNLSRHRARSLLAKE